MSEDLLGQLNPEQKEAVTHSEGPLLIVAGAGTGKTTVITQRIAWLIAEKKAKADEIMAVTFTDKAAGEMEERVDKMLPYGYVDLWISTFHSFCQRILEQHAIDIGLPNNFTLLNETGQWLLIYNNFDQFKLDYYRPLGNPTKFIHALLKHFSRAKDEAVFPEDYLEYAKEITLNSDSRGFISQILPKEEQEKLSAKELKELVTQEIKKINEVAEAYHTYQQLLHKNNALDFGDLIIYCLKLFQERPKLLAYYRNKFKYILVDEFQDTNWAQYELIKLLASPTNNLTVTGDDDQCLPGEAIVKMKDGEKKIKDVQAGDDVITAVGRGHLSYSKVIKVMRNKKEIKFITFRTERGYKVKVTDNHKMFCLVPVSPEKKDKKYHYVYLMQRQGFGWRLGITDDIAVRLKLERSADKILAIKTCGSDQEARYYETLYSLKYNIPTVCFKEREGVAIVGEWLEKLYKEIDTEANARKLAKDLNIDLDSHHYSLGAVNRGSRLRVKINLELCSRRYRSKHAKNNFLGNPAVYHLLTLETSDNKTINKLKRAGFKFKKGQKKGMVLRIQNIDIVELGRVAVRLQELTGGIIENSFKAGKTNIQSKKALAMPAKNVLVGQYLPVITDKGVIYDRVIDRQNEDEKEAIVYDLEVKKTHNFIANGVVVHNSIYKFRGASVSNVLQFKEDFPKSKEVFLIKNYRSSQNILDLSYHFIQLNNPERLEVKLAEKGGKLSKRLVAQKSGQSPVELLAVETQEDEMKTVVKKIVELKNKDKEATWSDFAILVRANSQADLFNYGLSQAGIPYQFVASRGLYSKPVVLDILAYLKLLDNYHESPALYRILSLPIFQFSQRDLINLNYWSKRKARSLYQTLLQSSTLPNIDERVLGEIKKVLGLIEKHTQLARDKEVSTVVLAFLEDSGYLQQITHQQDAGSQQVVSYLNQFYKKISEFEANSPDKSVKAFLNLMELEIESGEQGTLITDFEEGPEVVKVMTIHSAKGLEFKYVFIVNLVDRRFPTTERRDPIELPDKLVKEIIPSGDIHLQEERRLFYVACTRAKQGLYFSAAKDYGGSRQKKPSQFLYDVGIIIENTKTRKHENTENATGSRLVSSPAGSSSAAGVLVEAPTRSAGDLLRGKREYYRMPRKFSYSQLRAFESCPWQYRFAFILRVPVAGKHFFSFGKTIHIVLYKFFEQLILKRRRAQGELFGQSSAGQPTKKVGELVSLDEVMSFYTESWIDDWYQDANHKQQYFKKGKEILKDYYNEVKSQVLNPIYLEKGFNVKILDPANGRQYTLYGVIDRIDEVEGELNIIDYKTGQAKKSLAADDKDQLLIYQLAARQVFEQPVRSLTFEYLEGGIKHSFLGRDEDLKKIQEKVISAIKVIEKGEFVPRPSKLCAYCDFRHICEYRSNQ